ncbi:hypothetical protein AXF42_Ash020517 [Apostasia shenzhenica]|uniref:Uncharacterized protein n=1 Tax=Apostasia shenzhenica TaxID=1088818 RepID=A0A2H9ZY28_9ASPA|nr:hypothetical protein AXF42_Ash020517 [Apostasia shenzhenica]
MSPGVVSFFGPSGPPRLHVVGDRIGIMARANPGLPSHECCIGKFGLLSRSLSWCARAVLATVAGASCRSEVLENYLSVPSRSLECIPWSAVSVMSRGRESFFGPSGPPGLQVVGDCFRIMGRANPALPSREYWIGKFGQLSQTLSRCPRAILTTFAGASHRIRVLKNYLSVPTR